MAGPGAAELLERLCDNHVARGVGQITYTQMLNRRGGIECDFTVTRVDEELFSIVTGTAFGRHDLAWIRRHLPARERDGHGRDLALGVLRALGPALARDPPAAHARTSCRSRTCRCATSTVGDVPVRALRVTFVGELGWELYCPIEYGAGLWAALWEAGQPHGLVAGGYRAIDSLRLEKGYRVWGTDITPDETPYEAGLGFCVSRDKEFIGSDALNGDPAQRLCCLLLADPRSVALGNEPVRAGGEIRGRVTTGGYGYTVERSIAYAYLPSELASPGTAVEIEVFGDWVDAEVANEPLLDPKGERVRGVSATPPPAS